MRGGGGGVKDGSYTEAVGVHDHVAATGAIRDD